MKKYGVPILLAVCFELASIWFWYVLSQIYQKPFAWTSLNNDFNLSLIPLALAIVVMIVFSSLLTIFKLNPVFSKSTYGVSALTHVLFLPFGVLNLIAAAFFFFGYIAFERYTSEMLHNSIKIHFLDTYWRTVPSLITFFTFLIAFGAFQASIDKLDTLRITLPKGLVQQAVNLVTGSNVKGESTFIAQNTPSEQETQALDQLVNEQLSRFGITDPTQQAFIKQQVYQQAGLNVTVPMPTKTPSPNAMQTPPSQSATPPSLDLNKLINTASSLPGLQTGDMAKQLQEEYRDMLVQQTQRQLEQQLQRIIEQNKMYIPILNAAAIFFLTSIINIPVVGLSVATVAGVMHLLKAAKLISVVTVSMEVERLAW